MNWEQDCQDLYVLYTEKLEEFKESLENLETLINAIEQCIYIYGSLNTKNWITIQGNEFNTERYELFRN